MRMTILATALLATLTAASATADDDRLQTNIPAQDLAPALNTFASERNLQVVYRTDVVGALTTQGASGVMTAEEALLQLLKGTGLTFQYIGENAVTIVPANKASTSDTSSSEVSTERRPNESGTAPASKLDAQSAGIRLAQERGVAASESAPPAQTAPFEEIVVTAQKRTERLQDVPISISVLGGTDLDKSTAEGLTEALSRVPGVATVQYFQGGGTNVTVRGVTAGGALFSGSSPVSYYLDSVPFGLVSTAIAPDSNAYDMERVEVLRGPQGTLYGASAQNGVVRVLTHDANPDELELKVRTSVSTTKDGGENYRGDMAFNTPIVPGKLAARAVLGYQDSSGWIDKPLRQDVNDAQIRNARLKVNATPTDALSIGASAWLSRSDYGAPPVSKDDGQNSSLFEEPISTDYDVYGLKVGYDFSRFSLTSMSSYLDYANGSRLDRSPLGLNAVLSTRLDAQLFSQELILNSVPHGSWKWSAGVMYRDAEDGLRQNDFGGPPRINYLQGSESYALFGEIGRRFLDQKLEWALGLRYFHDDVFYKEVVSQGQPGEPLIDNRSSFDATTPRAVLTWYPTSGATIYASYSEGFRSGFPQVPAVIRAVPTFPAVEPDELHNYEIGAKLEGLRGRLAADVAVYFIDWQEVQQSLIVPWEQIYVTAVVNGESASGVGVDLGLTARPFSGLSVGLTLSWNDLTMDGDVYSSGVVLFNQGDRLNVSPEYTAGATLDYDFALGRGGYEATFSLSANYSSELDTRTIFRGSRLIAPGDEMLIARTSFSIVSPNRWTAVLFVDNFSDERGTVVVPPYGVPDWATRVRPMTAGVQLEYRF